MPAQPGAGDARGARHRGRIVAGRSQPELIAMDPWLQTLGIGRVNPGVFCGEWRGHGPEAEQVSPIDGRAIARVQWGAAEDYEVTLAKAQEAFRKWRQTPAPVRGETIRRL